MTITLDHISRIRDIAEADMNDADGKAWDEAVTPEVVIALCDRVEQLDKEAKWLAKALVERGHILGSIGNINLYRPWRDAARKAMEEACPNN